LDLLTHVSSVVQASLNQDLDYEYSWPVTLQEVDCEDLVVIEMRELKVEFEECEVQKCLVLAALFVEVVAEVAAAAVAAAVAAAAAHCLSVTVHGQLTSLHQSAATPSADASCETGVVWHRTVDK
jgi:hypothetical protein